MVNFIDQHPEDKILVFYKWTSSFERLERMLQAAQITSTAINGSVPVDQRSRNIRNFYQSKATNVMLIQVMLNAMHTMPLCIKTCACSDISPALAAF